jgi:large subunit ribosomal protein L2
MGRRILVRRRGRGGQNFRIPGHRKRGEVKYIPRPPQLITGKIMDFIHEGGRGTPIALVEYSTGRRGLWLPPEGVFIGDIFKMADKTELAVGNTMKLLNIPEGTLVYNVESAPEDGGKLCRASGTCATVMTRIGDKVQISFPSGKIKELDLNCRATIGVVAGGGRTTKPLLKASATWHLSKTKAFNFPTVTASSMNACSHPFGGGRKKFPGRPTTTARNTPPGRKVGLIAARRTGLRR